MVTNQGKEKTRMANGGFKFKKYTSAELETAGDRFVAAAKSRAQDLGWSSARWTDFVKDWFAQAARSDATVDSSTRSGEFLFDLAHTTWPAYSRTRFYTREYWDQALKGECELLLALESEWGKRHAPEVNLAKVLEDASKLAVARARVKVVAFGSETGEADREQIVGYLKRLRSAAKDDRPWLWVDLPWQGTRGEWRPASGVLK
jgi:hypothetical protein